MMREDWVEVELGELLKLNNGYAFKSSMYTSAGVPIIRISDINNGIIELDKAVKVEQNDEYEKYSLEYGDILIAMSGATTGKFGMYRLNKKAYQNQRVGNFKIHSESIMFKNFLYYLLFFLKEEILEKAYGGAQPNISSKKIEGIKIWLPSMPEQRAIVTKIEELFSELDSGIDSLKKAKKQLEVYRQAVLKSAFEGKLTKKWREENSIKSSNWIRTRLDEVSIAIGGYAFKSKNFKETGKYQVIRIGNIRPGQIRYNASPVFIDDIEENVLTRYKLNLKDVLITLTGTRNKRDYGYTALVNSTNLLLNQRVAALRFNDNCIPEYFLYYSWTNEFKNQFFASETGNVGQGNVGMKSIRNTNIALPLFSEQEQIIKEIESRLSVCENIEANIEEAFEKAEALRHSILKKAFEGKLLSKEELEVCKQEDDWEPSEKLLKRIKEATKEVK